ncbi:hypothetical protein [Thiolapillus sp.]
MTDSGLPLLSRAVADLADAETAGKLARFRAHGDASDLLTVCDALFPRLEDAIWQSGRPDGTALEHYQALAREVDACLAAHPDDPRHEFLVVVPVADRPRHLQAFLHSLQALRRHFPWGRVAALVADDSGDPENIAENRRIVQAFRAQGLEVRHFGQEEQLARLDTLDEQDRQALAGVLGNHDRARFWHKGASNMRNITCLELVRLAGRGKKTLFWFADSDQEFRAGDGCFLNYFFHLDRIFSRRPVTLLTGKVVGDPPVSPAVMAGNFLDDMLAFVTDLSTRGADDDCVFHRETEDRADDAAYHDMAELFGFREKGHSFPYHCPLEGPHDHRRCFEAWAHRLKGFFDGEHLTRGTAYEYRPLAQTLVPARTVYTGNYVFNRAGLSWFIPFASLKLRMAGPVLGRMVAAELGEAFLSANLPMLHKRTLAGAGRSEFRPGIVHDEELSDISGEFERQYFGDVMLFSMIRFTEQGYPARALSGEDIRQVLEAVEQEMRERYEAKRQHILSRSGQLRILLEDRAQWWHDCPDAVNGVRRFLDSMEHSFGDGAEGVRLMRSVEHRRRRLADMEKALLAYREQRARWEEVLA